MAKAPTPESIGVVAPQIGGRTPSLPNPGIVGQAMQKTGADLSQAGAELLQTHDAMAQAQATKDFLAAKLELDQKAENDPDYATMPQRYGQDLQAAADKAAQGIVTPARRAQFQEGLTRLINFGQERALSISRAKGVDADRGWLTNYMDGAADQYARATDDQTRETIINSAQQALDAVQSKGSLTAEQAAHWGVELHHTFAEQRAGKIAVTNPALYERLFAPSAPATGEKGGDLPTPATPAAPPAYLPAELGSGIQLASAKYGSNPDTSARTAWLESRGGADPNANGNVFQFKGSTASDFGVTGSTPIADQAAAEAQLQMKNRAALTQALGRDPTEAEIYLAHQQGAAGAAALIQNPDKSAVDVLMGLGMDRKRAIASITGNGGSQSVTAGTFVQHWGEAFSNGPPTSYQRPGATGGTKSVTNPIDNTEYNFPTHGDWRDAVRPEKQLAFLELAQRKLAEQGVQERGDVERRFKNNLVSALHTGEYAEPLSDNEIRGALPKNPDQAEHMIRQLQGAVQVGQATQKIALASPDEEAQILRNFVPKPGPDYADQVMRAGALEEAAKLKRDQLMKDPSSYVLQNSPEMRSALEQVLQGNPMPDTLAAALTPGSKAGKKDISSAAVSDQGTTLIPQAASPFDKFASTMLAYQSHLGVADENQHVLTPGMAQSMSRALTTLQSDPATGLKQAPDAATMLKQIKDQWGNSYDHVFSDMATMGKLPVAYQLVGAIPDAQGAADLATLLREEKKGTDPEKILGPKVVSGTVGIKPTIRDDPTVAQFRNSLLQSKASLPFTENMIGAIDQLAYAKMLYGGMSQADAVSYAIHTVAGGYDYRMAGGPRVPSDVIGNVATAADDALLGLNEKDIIVPKNSFGGHLQPTQLDYVRNLQANPKWVTDKTEKGIYLFDDGNNPVLTKDGKPLYIPFTAVPTKPVFGMPPRDNIYAPF